VTTARKPHATVQTQSDSVLSYRSKRLCLIIALAAVSRLVLATTLPPQPTWPDGRRYNSIAQHVLRHGAYPTDEHRSSPLHPLVLSVLYAASGSRGVVARIFFALLGTYTCFIVYKLSRLVFNETISWCACLLLAIYPLHIYSSCLYECPQALFILLLLLGTYNLLYAHTKRDSTIRWGAAGLAFGFAALAIPTILTAMPFIAVYLLSTQPLAFRHRLFRVVLLGASCTCIVLTWSVYRLSSTGSFQLVSGAAAEHLFKGNCRLAWRMGKADIADRYHNESPPPEDAKAFAEYEQIQRQACSFPPGPDRDRVYRDAVLSFFRDAPGEAVSLLGRKAVLYWWPYAQTVTRHGMNCRQTRIVQFVSYVPIAVLALIGILTGTSSFRGFNLLLVIIITQWLTYSALLVNTRYRLHVDAFLIVLAAPVLALLLRRFLLLVRRSRPQAGADAPGAEGSS